MTSMVRDAKTGRLRRADPKRSAAAKKGARKRRGKHLSSSTKKAISKGVKKAIRTKRTASGRRTVR